MGLWICALIRHKASPPGTSWCLLPERTDRVDLGWMGGAEVSVTMEWSRKRLKYKIKTLPKPQQKKLFWDRSMNCLQATYLRRRLFVWYPSCSTALKVSSLAVWEVTSGERGRFKAASLVIWSVSVSGSLSSLKFSLNRQLMHGLE